MAGLTKAQRAAKEAAKEEEVVETLHNVAPDSTDVKFRYDFKSWDAYNKYKGKKG